MPDDLLKRFCEETLDQIRELSADILRSEKAEIPDSLFEGILRTLHSIKGSSRMLGLSRFGEMVHAAEDLFSYISDKPEYITSDVIDSLLSAIDTLEEAIQAIYEDSDRTDYDGALDSIALIQEGLQRSATSGLDEFLKTEPELFQALTPQQNEELISSYKNYRHLYVMELSFSRVTFSADVRSVHTLLKNSGKLISTTGTTTPPAKGYDLKFLFLQLSNDSPENVGALFSKYVPQIREIPLPVQQLEEVAVQVEPEPEPEPELPSPEDFHSHPNMTQVTIALPPEERVETRKIDQLTLKKQFIEGTVDVGMLEQYAPEIHDVLSPQQKDILESHYKQFDHLYVLELSFSRNSFSRDVRNINKQLNAGGKLISTTGTTRQPAPGFDLKFLFLILSNAAKSAYLEIAEQHAPTIIEIPSLIRPGKAAPQPTQQQPPERKSAQPPERYGVGEKKPPTKTAPVLYTDQDLARFERLAPEIFQVLGGSQIDSFMNARQLYDYIYILNCCFSKDRFSNNVREVTSLLNSKGLLISTTGTAQRPEPGYDLRFLFLFLSDETEETLSIILSEYIPIIRPIPKDGIDPKFEEEQRRKAEEEAPIFIPERTTIAVPARLKLHGPASREARKGSTVEQERRERLLSFSGQAPEVLSVLTPQQEDTLLSQYGRYKHIFLLELSFKRNSFAGDIRKVTGDLSRRGLLLSSTGTGNQAVKGYDLRFAFFLLTNEPEETITALCTVHAPYIREIFAPKDAGKIQQAPDRKVETSTAQPAGEGADLKSGATLNRATAESAAAAQPAAPPKKEPAHEEHQYDDDFVKLQEWFLDEGEEILRTLNTDIVSLEKEGDKEIVHAIFRSFHNLKGSGGSYNFPNISRIAHIMESFVLPYRSSIEQPDSAAIDKMLRGVDMLGQVFQFCKEGRHDKIDISKLEEDLRSLIKGEAEEPQQETVETGAQPSRTVESAAVEMSAASSAAPPAVEEEEIVVQEVSYEPVQRQEEPQKQPATEFAPDVDESSGPAPSRPAREKAPVSKTPDSIRVNLRKLDSIVSTAVELSVAHASEQRILQELNEALETHSLLVAEWKSIEERLRQIGVHASNRVHALTDTHSKSLSQFQRHIRELFSQIEAGSFRRSRLATDLGDEALQLQLQPLSTLFDTFQRIVRDLSKTLEKPTDLVIHDQYVEVDRRIIEALKDPFTHLLRNAIDHGIEKPATRLANKKPDRGKITITARQMGFSFVINVTDDGCGIDKESLAKSIVNKGLATRDEVETMHESELFSYLFKPGFSTQTKVTDISGRGVGLDVVETNVRQLGGEVQVFSELGKGTTFSIHLPTNLTLSRALVIEVHDRTFSFPVATTERVVALPPSAVERRNGSLLTAYEDTFIPVVEIEQLLGLERSTLRMRNGLIIRKRDLTICLSVPRILDETELITKPMPPHLRTNRLVSGVNVLSDGRLALVLNPAAITPQLRIPEKEVEHRAAPRKRLLVVDDSLIARELLSNILIAFDYDVNLARDGKEALQFLKMHMVDLIISDVDMPNMNGYALTKAVKSDPELQKIPIIIITAKESNRDRMDGLEIGADEYLFKGSFNQQNLIDTVEHLLERPGT